jgi:Ca2+-binding EF-hand superfamily protein
MKKLATLALVLALGAGCNKSSSDSTPKSGESAESGGGEQAAPNGRSGKIDLPSLKSGGVASADGDKADKGERPDRKERIKKFDTDGDGQLSETEREAMRNARRDEMMKRIDTDGDGKISPEEREAAQAEREAMRAERDAERTKREDTDGDGKVSDAERAAAQTQRVQDMHTRYDANGDGKLTTDELGASRRFRGDASKADTNGDGVISNDELQKSMEDSRRNGRRGDFGGPPGAYRPQ